MAVQRRLLDSLREYNERHHDQRADNSNLAARIASYELAFKMQSAAPEAVDLSQETESTHKLYGLEQKATSAFGRQCLLARRLVERGRFVLSKSIPVAITTMPTGMRTVTWKFNHDLHAGETDKPVAALLKDLARRNLLDETLVVWGGEFGRQPTAEYAKGTGRDHNSYGFTMFLAGGGRQGRREHRKDR